MTPMNYGFYEYEEVDYKNLEVLISVMFQFTWMSHTGLLRNRVPLKYITACYQSSERKLRKTNFRFDRFWWGYEWKKNHMNLFLEILLFSPENINQSDKRINFKLDLMDMLSPNASVEETHIDYLYNNMQDIIGWVP